jgi:phytoene dehydrogenase-like protein
MHSPLPQARRHAIVIGSGFGGMASAIRLARRGWKVSVLEKLDAPGGRAYVWRQDGFTFDAGPTIITAPHLLDEIWALCGFRFADDVELRPMEPFYRIRFQDGSWFDYSGDAARMRAEVARFCPEDLPGYESFIQEAQRCYELGFLGLGGIAFDTLGDLLKAVPAMVKMRAWESIYTMVARHFRDPKLRIVMSFHPLLIGGNPFSVTCVYSPDQYPRAPGRCPLGDGRDGRNHPRDGRPAAAHGRKPAMQCRGHPHRDRGRARHRCPTCRRQRDPRRHRGVQCRHGLDLPVTSWSRAGVDAGATRRSSAAGIR